MVVLVSVHAGGNWFGAPAPVIVRGADFTIVRGSGQPIGGTLALDSLDRSGSAVLSTRVPTFPAERYPRVEWNLHAPGPVQPALTFAWRNREHPGRTYHKPLEWVDGHVAPLRLDTGDGWTGSIIGVELIVRGEMSAPLLLESFTVPGVWLGTAALDLRQQWTTYFPFRGNSLTFPFDEERTQPLSLLAATAIAQLLAVTGYVLVARRSNWPMDRRVVWTIFIAGWFVLDARWQINLWRQLGDTAGAFAGKSNDQKHLAAADHELFTLMREMSAALPPPPVRIIFLADNQTLRVRGAFFLYPHSVNAFYQDSPRTARAPDAHDLHAGDYVLLFLYSGVVYDRARKMLVWVDGTRKAVDEVLWKSDAVVLLRLR